MIIDGKALALKIKDKLKQDVIEFEKSHGRKIKLAVVLVGENPASQVYVRNKIKAAEYVGIESLSYVLPENSLEKEVGDLIKTLADENSIDGILVQLPLPRSINADNILALISSEKDVDGFSYVNAGKLMQNKPCIEACTPSGIMTMLKETGINLCGKNAVVLGRSNIVGKPVAALLLNENCTVTVCHSKTVNLKEICINADIIIAAIGKAGFVTADMVKEGAIVIDVGINRTENGLKGDVDFDGVVGKASYITPVPGGVGPMTIATLLCNAYKCAVLRG